MGTGGSGLGAENPGSALFANQWAVWWLDVLGLKRAFQFPAVSKYDLEVTRHLGSPPMMGQMKDLNPAGLYVVIAGRVDPLIRVQLEAGFTQDVEPNWFIQPMPSKVGDVEKVLIDEIARRAKDAGGIGAEGARGTYQ